MLNEILFNFGCFLVLLDVIHYYLGYSITTNEDVRSKSKLCQNGIVRSYLVGAVLTQAEEGIILKLAKKRGIKKVGKIVTHYMLPSSAKAIRVEGFAEKKGREVSREILSVTRKGWTFPNAKPGKNDLVLGDFWAGNVYVRKQVELNVSGKIYLCSSVYTQNYIPYKSHDHSSNDMHRHAAHHRFCTDRYLRWRRLD